MPRIAQPRFWLAFRGGSPALNLSDEALLALHDRELAGPPPAAHAAAARRSAGKEKERAEKERDGRGAVLSSDILLEEGELSHGATSSTAISKVSLDE